MPSAYRLRPSAPQDRDALHAVWRSAVLATHDFLSPDDFEFFSAMVCEEYLRSRNFLMAMDDSEQPIGFLGATDNEIEALFVHADHHGRGVGRLLLSEPLNRSGELFVEVNEQNHSARGFYERLGFRIVSRSELDSSGRPYPILRMTRSA